MQRRGTGNLGYWLALAAAGAIPLPAPQALAGTTRPARGSNLLQAQQGRQSDVISNIYTRKGRSLQAINANERRIWNDIHDGHLRQARALIRQTAAAFPGWHPRRAMDFVLLEKSIWMAISAHRIAAARVRMSALQARYGQGPLAAETRAALTSMHTVLTNDRLWSLLGHDRLKAAQAAIRRFQDSHPGYRPPRKLLVLLHEDRAARALGRLERTRSWRAILALHHREPAIFTRAEPGHLTAFAQALAATGHRQRARTVFAALLGQARDLDQAEALLRLAGAHLRVPEMQALYARAQARFPKDWRAFRDQHLRYLLMKAAQAHAAHHDRRALRWVASQASAIRALHAATDARLMGTLYGARHEQRAALTWWLRAARWSRRPQDWRTVGTLALADRDLALVGVAIAHLPPGRARQAFRRQEDFDEALAAYRHHQYPASLAALHAARAFGPLPSGMRAIQAWSLLHMGHDRRAAALFTALYRQRPTSGTATGLLIADQHLHALAAAYRLAAQVKGPLAARLPMIAMRDHLADINEMPWRFLAPDTIAAPSPRESYLALGGSVEERGGPHSGLARLDAFAPSVQAQLGINWHLAAFAQVSSPLLLSGAPTAAQLPSAGGTSGPVAVGGVTSRVWDGPGFLVGIDDRRPHQHWRAALGLTSPMLGHTRTVQGLLRYTAIPSRTGSRFGFHVLRDSVRQSLTSFHGIDETLDPVVHGTTVPISARWGGVVRNQVGASAYASGGQQGWSLIGTLHVNALTGDNVRTNYGASTYLALMHPIFTDRHWWVTLGPSLYAEAYRYNEDFASPGYGGYFSPQGMGQPSLSASASHWWHGGAINVSTAVGYQWLYETGGPFIGSPALQQALGPRWTAAGLVAAPYGTTRGHNVAGSVNVTWTQRLLGRWYLDAGASYQANPAFQEADAGIDVRDVFGSAGGRTLIPAQYIANMGRYE